MKIRLISLQESIIDNLMQKYSGIIPNDVLEEFKSLDLKKPHKYLPWMLKQYAKVGKKTSLKDMLKFAKGVEKGLLKKKDINQYSVEELEDAVKNIKLPEEEKEEIKSEAEIIVDDDRFIIVIPKSHRCSVEYGSPKWCTSYKSPLNWNKYSPYLGSHIELFYVIPKFKVPENFKKAAMGIYTRKFSPEKYERDVKPQLEEKFAEMTSGNYIDPIMHQAVVVDLTDVKKAEDFVYEHNGYFYMAECFDYNNKLKKMSTIVNTLHLEDYLDLIFEKIE